MTSPSSRSGVVVCRGCCCGNATKHPGTDHVAELARLEEFAAANPARFSVRTSECLGPCERANVIVVRPSPRARRAGAVPSWFGDLTDQALTALLAWVAAGGPGALTMPAVLARHHIPRPGTAS
ncbi:(2Fe-2S) ferredoxin domain-containing protein [Amycolatopsis sp. cg5]|uniref:(2Fe-2S) ferredoxin domain-containing protein n=1 Tax=Amycolatopsis sp. cg5 TaxID=3238802 RepID=UPI003524D695